MPGAGEVARWLHLTDKELRPGGTCELALSHL